MTDTQEDFETVTWDTLGEMTNDLTQTIRASGRTFDCILAISRGGLVPATLLAQAFELRTVLVTTVLFYTDEGQPFFGLAEPRFLAFPPAAALAGRSVLIVDDVHDTGRTLRAVRSKVLRCEPKEVAAAVLHYKQGDGLVKEKSGQKNVVVTENDGVSMFYVNVTQNWVVYPWEFFSPSGPSCGPPVKILDGQRQQKVKEEETESETETEELSGSSSSLTSG